MADVFTLDRLERAPSKQLMAYRKYCSSSSTVNTPIILFGAGKAGALYLEFLRGHYSGPLLFCDNDPNKWGTSVAGVPIISFQDLLDAYHTSYIVITSLDYYNIIRNQLLENNLGSRLEAGFEILFSNDYEDYFSIVNTHYDKFRSVYSLLNDELSRKIFLDRLNYCITANTKYLIPFKSKYPQYFEPGIITLTKEEIFIDGGAYTGDTVEEFLKCTGGKFKSIYSFEPEETKHGEFLNKFEETDKIKLLPFGLWSKKDLLRFSATNDGGSSVSENGDIEIPVVSIDEVLNGEPATFIKMDIEGAELEALKGAENTIRKYKPKLAICVYHKPLDIVDIPLYLKDIVPEYKIFLRHYNNDMYETICYAVTD